MASVTRSVAIKAFLEQNTHADLAAMYNASMECQVNVAQDGGERVDRHYQGKNFHEYTDGITPWKPFRIPRNAWTEPEGNDYEIKFDLSEHVEAIGMTGWNWMERRSLWVAYDFDGIVGHSERHKKKLTDEELVQVRNTVMAVPWVTLRKSTGGGGLHLYVYIGVVVETQNHNEHMALARAILGQLSANVNFDFASKVDGNGGNMWVWHRKMVGSDGGLSLIRKGEPLLQIPPNWKDHLDVIKGKRKRIVPFFVKESDKPADTESLFDELSGQRQRVPLDEGHNGLINWLASNVPGGSWWDDDHWMLVTHTYYLKQAHAALHLKGVFKTLSTGKEFGADHNCFAFPLKDGAWTIRRYTPGVAEDQTWNQDGQGWTTCYYNKIPTLRIAALAFEGVEKTNGGFAFKTAKIAADAAKMLGADIKLAEWASGRGATLKKHKDGRIILELTREAVDSSDDMRGWDHDTKVWKRIYSTKMDSTGTVDVPNFDQIIRHIVTSGGDNYGWVIKSDGVWKHEPMEHLKVALEGEFNFKPPEIKAILGAAVVKPYTLVNRPFDVEYPPGRLWNKKAAKFRYEQSQNLENLNYPTWLKIFDHLGKGLDLAVKNNAWARGNNIKSGSDYLLVWAASLFQKPMEQLPYLFFWSEHHNTGKTAFHESLQLLMTGGYERADKALEPSSSFNGELQYAILCVVEETDLNKSRSGASTSYNRIKDWVTTKHLPIHEKGKTPYLIPNSTHWVQCANNRHSCPIFPGDSRITMIHVEDLDPLEMIPKTKLIQMLEKEAPDFLSFIMRLEIPPSNDRLNIPVIATDDKETAEEANMTMIELFIKEHCHVVDGEVILWSDFYDEFAKAIETHYLETWTKIYTGRHLPAYHPKARHRLDAQWYIANLSFKPRDPDKPKMARLVSQNQYLVPLTETNGHTTDAQQNPPSAGVVADPAEGRTDLRTEV